MHYSPRPGRYSAARCFSDRPQYSTPQLGCAPQDEYIYSRTVILMSARGLRCQDKALRTNNIPQVVSQKKIDKGFPKGGKCKKPTGLRSWNRWNGRDVSLSEFSLISATIYNQNHISSNIKDSLMKQETLGTLEHLLKEQNRSEFCWMMVCSDQRRADIYFMW